jgi:hypothetical protein
MKSDIKKELIKIAYENPELRGALLKIIKKADVVGGKLHLYHATTSKSDLSNIDSFRKGISSKKSHGMSAKQGNGFYLFHSRQEAIKRLHSDSAVNTGTIYPPYREHDKATDGYKLLITLEVDKLDPLKFSLDNEVSGEIIIEKLTKNLNKIQEMGKKQGFTFRPVNAPPGVQLSGHKMRVDIPSKGVSGIIHSIDMNASTSGYLHELVKIIEEGDPAFWYKLEEEMFKEATAIKYTGEELIKPFKIEVVNDDNSTIDVTENNSKLK